jgi:hypothetical protein
MFLNPMFKSPFVVVRYAPGSAGRVISVMLQLSSAISSWNTLFNKTDLIKNINIICDQMNVPYPDEQLLALTFNIWWDSQHKILEQYTL